MPITNGVGHSDSTILKIEVLSKIVAMHFVITQAVIKKHPTFRQKYRYLDLTAGKGYGSDSDTVSKVDKIHALEWSGKSLVHNTKLFGSPLVFLTIAESSIAKSLIEGILLKFIRIIIKSWMKQSKITRK